MKKTSDKFYTAELPLAATLLTMGFPLDYFTTEPQGRVSFVFTQSQEFLSIVQQFWQRKLSVNVHTFYENLKFLKARLRNGTPETKN